ncbi:MAG: ribonuclease J [Acidobacteria bacterium]|nr:ribonuclease J [Acidobacteriota bacterium]
MSLRIIPLGGLGEFGRNTMVFETGRSAIIVDCGMSFPEPSTLGVDVVLPDLTYVESIREKVHGIFLTHGHEDHIGAVPYLANIVDAPIFGRPLTLAFVKEKFVEMPPANDVDLRVIRPREAVEVGDFRVEAIHVTHSIVDAAAFAIQTPEGMVIHTGDYKFDPTPVAGPPSDLARFGQLGDEGVTLLVGDSTNSMSPGVCGSESSVGRSLEKYFESSEGRIFFTTFASHVHRLQQVVELAEEFDRRIWLVGRSLIENVAHAERLGYLSIPRHVRGDGKTVDDDDLDAVIICSGSQGEPNSSLARIARREHRVATVVPGDMVIFSARTIPGNERSVMHVIDHLLDSGAEIVYEQEGIHVSGHAYLEELKTMFTLTRPRFFIPAHGSRLNLERHAEVAEAMGIEPNAVLRIVNGDVAEIDGDVARILDEKVPAGRVFVDREQEEVPTLVVRDRQHLGEDGFVIVVAAIDQQAGELVRDPEIITRGVIHVDANQAFIDEVRKLLRDAMNDASLDEIRDVENVQEMMRRELKRFFRKRLGRRPMILPVVWEM